HRREDRQRPAAQRRPEYDVRPEWIDGAGDHGGSARRLESRAEHPSHVVGAESLEGRCLSHRRTCPSALLAVERGGKPLPNFTREDAGLDFARREEPPPRALNSAVADAPRE